jgi:hypothetical protein
VRFAVGFRNKYYRINKDNSLYRIKNAIENLEGLFSQEAEDVVSTDLIEVEGLNTISCPPHFVQLIATIKALKELEQRVEDDQFISLQNKEE